MNNQVQLTDILSTIKFNQGFMPTHELAMMLGKRHRDLVSKLKAECIEDGEDWTRKFRSQKVETYSGKGRAQTYDSYLLPEEDAVSLAMSYDRKLAKLVYRAFKAALEVVDAVNAGEDPAVIAQKAEESTYSMLSNIVYDQVCLKSIKASERKAIAVCIRMAAVENGGVMESLSNLKEFLCSFAVQAELKKLPLRSTFKTRAMQAIDSVYAAEKKRIEDHKEYLRNHASSW